MNHDGRVGIGTTTPYANLTVAGSLGLTGAFFDRTSSAGTNGMVLRTTGSGTEWIATSTLGLSASFTNSAELGALLSDETGVGGLAVFNSNPLLAGFRSNASSTIGGGTGATGLTIS